MTEQGPSQEVLEARARLAKRMGGGVGQMGGKGKLGLPVLRSVSDGRVFCRLPETPKEYRQTLHCRRE